MKDCLLICCQRHNLDYEFSRFPFSQILSSSLLWNNGVLKRKSWYPAGVTYLAASAKDAGFEVDILDLDTCIPSKIEKVCSEVISNYKYIGISFITMSYPIAIKVAKLAKRLNPQCKIVMGGPHASFAVHDILTKNSFVDFIITGEGEQALVSLLNNDIAAPGIAYLDKNHEIVLTPSVQITDLDSLPFPSRDKLKAIDYHYFDEIPIITARGCPRKCDFCVETKLFDKIRFRSAKNVVDEIEHVIQTIGSRSIMFVDSNFATSKRHAKSIIDELISRNITLEKLYCLGHVDYLDYDFLEILRHAPANTLRVEIGVESLNESMITNKKTFNLNNYRQRLISCINHGKKLGIQFTLNYMLPLPQQTKKISLKEITLLKTLGDVHTFILTPYPGTPMWNPEVLEQSDPDFRNYNSHRVVFNSSEMSHKDMKIIYRRATSFKSDCLRFLSSIPPLYNRLKGWH